MIYQIDAVYVYALVDFQLILKLKFLGAKRGLSPFLLYLLKGLIDRDGAHCPFHAPKLELENLC